MGSELENIRLWLPSLQRPTLDTSLARMGQLYQVVQRGWAGSRGLEKLLLYGSYDQFLFVCGEHFLRMLCRDYDRYRFGENPVTDPIYFYSAQDLFSIASSSPKGYMPSFFITDLIADSMGNDAERFLKMFKNRDFPYSIKKRIELIDRFSDLVVPYEKYEKINYSEVCRLAI